MFCPTCGHKQESTQATCAACGARLPTSAASGDAEALSVLIPVDTPWAAIAAGYAGLFSVLVLPAPVALALGAIGLAQISRRPGSRGRVRCWVGIVLGTCGSLAGIAMIVAACLR